MTTVSEYNNSQSISDMLEHNPEKLKTYLENSDNKEAIKRWINSCKSYYNWFSPSLHQLFYVTGKLITKKRANFFGCQTELDEYLACELFDLLQPFHPNPEDTNYNNVNFYKLVTRKSRCLTQRTHNQVFINHIMDYYHWEYPSQSSIGYLNTSHPLTDLLESNPLKFKEYLEEESNVETIQKWVSGECKVYRAYISSALHQLAYITGDISKSYWGSFGSKTYLQEEVAIEIFDLLLKFNPDENDTNYYGETLYDLITSSIYKEVRYNNEKFTEYVMNHYNWS